MVGGEIIEGPAMGYFGNIILLAGCVAIALWSCAFVVFGLVARKVKAEPSKPWVYLRVQPVRFLVTIGMYALIGATAACMSLKEAASLIH
jgi:hypothetical protein